MKVVIFQLLWHALGLFDMFSFDTALYGRHEGRFLDEKLLLVPVGLWQES